MGHLISEPNFKIPTPPPPLLISDKSLTTAPEFPFEEDKYGLHYVHVYLENFVDTVKRSIAGVIKALADDEKLEPF